MILEVSAAKKNIRGNLNPKSMRWWSVLEIFNDSVTRSIQEIWINLPPVLILEASVVGNLLCGPKDWIE